MTSLLNISNGTRADVDYSNFKVIYVSLSKGINEFLVTLTAKNLTTSLWAQTLNDIISVNKTQGDLYVSIVKTSLIFPEFLFKRQSSIKPLLHPQAYSIPSPATFGWHLSIKLYACTLP